MTVAFEVAADFAGSGQPSDIDLAIVDADGASVAHGAGSAGHERILVGPEALSLAPTPWTLVVYNCTPQQGAVNLELVRYL